MVLTCTLQSTLFKLTFNKMTKLVTTKIIEKAVVCLWKIGWFVFMPYMLYLVDRNPNTSQRGKAYWKDISRTRTVYYITSYYELSPLGKHSYPFTLWDRWLRPRKTMCREKESQSSLSSLMSHPPLVEIHIRPKDPLADVRKTDNFIGGCSLSK